MHCRSRGRGRNNRPNDHGHGYDSRFYSKGPRTFEGIPILYPPNAREYDEVRASVQLVKEKLGLHFSLHFGRHGRFLTNDQYYNAEVPDPPNVPIDPNNHATVVQRKTYEVACSEIVKISLKMNDQRTSWFSTIMRVLSQASKDLVEAEDEWEQVNEDQDPLELWHLVERTHLTRITGSTDIDRANALEAYNSIRQEKNENLADYKKRHERAISALERVQYPQIPDDRMQVTKWIRGLNDKHQEWKVKMVNSMQEGNDPPASLEEAMSNNNNNNILNL